MQNIFRGLILGIAVAALLSGCASSMQTARRGMIDANNEAVRLKHRVKEYFTLPPVPPPPQSKPLEPRYCYKTLTDILCYRDPHPDFDAEERLVGYQEPLTRTHEGMYEHVSSIREPTVTSVPVQPVEAMPFGISYDGPLQRPTATASNTGGALQPQVMGQSGTEVSNKPRSLMPPR